jgi:hypothetical protein
MSTTVRQSVTLSMPQEQFLKQESERLGLSVSEVIRRIIDKYREEREGKYGEA